ncbi:hypothetical protein B0I35DRAFT_200908 [Stachybotrys elegans]|uniref:Uncharacterized protein n=1 Tax=Stachybotrys elegans TaxID=80388 RepID=A0A8K0STX7_9HYPO|nr:hypothetical protein B0I35DRAFT_200908 [Stachybotrys elegans]
MGNWQPARNGLCEKRHAAFPRLKIVHFQEMVFFKIAPCVDTKARNHNLDLRYRVFMQPSAHFLDKRTCKTSSRLLVCGLDPLSYPADLPPSPFQRQINTFSQKLIPEGGIRWFHHGSGGTAAYTRSSSHYTIAAQRLILDPGRCRPASIQPPLISSFFHFEALLRYREIDAHRRHRFLLNIPCTHWRLRDHGDHRALRPRPLCWQAR